MGEHGVQITMMTAEKIERIESDVRSHMAKKYDTVATRNSRLKSWHFLVEGAPGWMWRVESFADDGTARVQVCRWLSVKPVGKTLCEVFAAEEAAKEEPPK